MLKLLYLLTHFLYSASAWEFTALGGLNYASPTQITNGAKQNWEGIGRFSYGFFLSDSISTSAFSWETGIFFENSKFEQPGVTTLMLEENVVPLLIQFHFDEWVQMGGGYYRSWAKNTPPGALTKIDSGLWFNLRAHFHVLPRFSLLLEGRYQHGLANRAADASDTFNTRSVQVLGGFEFAL